MKSIKLLAAVGILAMLTACTKEEAYAPMQESDAFVGAELVGTNISMNFGKPAESKLTGSAWELSDKLGLGWVVKTAYTTPQLETAAPDQSILFANHMFATTNGYKFTTKGNIYKGWHFAYYPFQYMESLGTNLKVSLNPNQTTVFTTDRYNTCLYLSPLEFLAKGKGLDNNYEMNDVNYELYRAFNTIGVTVKPNSTFTTQAALNNLAIKSITIDAGTKTPFYTNDVTVNPTKLSKIAYDANGNYLADSTKNRFFRSLASALSVADVRPSVTVNVENAEINTSGDQTLRINVLPMATANLAKEDVTFVIEVEAGTFTIDYTPAPVAPAVLTPAQVTNNTAIENLVAAYAAGGTMSKYNVNNGVLGLELSLTEADFEPNFTAIRSESEWNAAVAVADALGMTAATFKIAKTNATTPANWSFKDVDGDGVLVNLPAANLKVTGEPMILAEEGEWPAVTATKLNVETDVVVDADLTVEGNMDIKAGNTITNNATIFVGSQGALSSKTKNALNNEDGRVIVKYGAYVYAQDLAHAGTIAYVVENTTMSDIQKVNTLINTTNVLGNANVNTLIVKTVLDLNAQAVSGTVVGDRYNSITSTDDFLVNLANVNVELENGSLVHNLAGANTSVKNVTAVAGSNIVDDVVVLNDIATKEDATLNVNSSLLKTYTVNEIINEGTINSNVEVLISNKVDNEIGTLNVATGKFVYYKDQYIQGGTAVGYVLKSSVTSTFNPSDVTTSDYAVSGTTVSIGSAKGLLKVAAEGMISGYTYELAADIDMAGINWTGIVQHGASAAGNWVFDGKDHTIKNMTGSVGLFTGNSVKGTIKNLTIENAVVYSTFRIQGIVAGQMYGNVTNVIVKDSKISGVATTDNEKFGGIIGQYAGDAPGVMSNCTVENVTVIGTTGTTADPDYAGGLVGFEAKAGRVYTNCTVKNCVISGENAGEFFGGLQNTAAADAPVMTNCTKTGNQIN